MQRRRRKRKREGEELDKILKDIAKEKDKVFV